MYDRELGKLKATIYLLMLSLGKSISSRDCQQRYVTATISTTRALRPTNNPLFTVHAMHHELPSQPLPWLVEQDLQLLHAYGDMLTCTTHKAHVHLRDQEAVQPRVV
jgi:hypothetical protein